MNSRILLVALVSSAAFILETATLQVISMFEDYKWLDPETAAWPPEQSSMSSSDEHGTTTEDDPYIPPSPKVAPLELFSPSGEVAVFFNAYLEEATNENHGKMRRRGLQIIDLMLERMRDSKHLAGKIHLYYSHISAEQMSPVETQDIMCKYLPPDKCTEVHRVTEGDEKDTLTKLFEYCQKAPPQELVMYLHNKGAYHASSENEWLRNLHVRGLVSTDGCYQGFMSQSSHLCNICSARFSPMPHFHTSGNMWMAKCGYIQRLLDPQMFEERMTELMDTQVLSSKDNLMYWAPQCSEQSVIEYHTDLGVDCPAPWSVGKGRYAAEHWVHSHPSVQPCDVLPMNHNASMSYRWNYDLLPRNVRWKPELASAPRFPLEDYVSPNSDVNIASPLTKWTKLEGRLLEWSFLYNETPPEDSWIWKYYEENNALE